MKIFIDNFRLWWQVPRRAGDRIKHRQVSFLELFYDLVYVVLIAQLSHQLANDISWIGIGKFAFLFIMVWWSWVNGTSYHDVHGNNDIRTRVFTFLQMFAVISMAIFAHDAIGENSIGFAISYICFQVLLTILWWRTGVHDADHRPLSIPYSLFFIVIIILFTISIFVDEPTRYYYWLAAVVISIVVPLFMRGVALKRITVPKQFEVMSQTTPSLVERFGLFTIIVLGEVIVSIVNGAARHHHITFEIGIMLLFSILIAIGIWWLYFDFVSHRSPKKGYWAYGYWYYLHLPIVMGIITVGAALYNIFQHGDHSISNRADLLLIFSLVVILISISQIIRILEYPKEMQPIIKRGVYTIFSIALIIASLSVMDLPHIQLLVTIAFLQLVPVIIAVTSWIKQSRLSNDG